VEQALRALLPHEGGDHRGGEGRSSRHSPRYFAHNNNPIRAVSCTEELLDRCQALAHTLRAYPLGPRYESFGIRRCVHGDYLIVYRLQPEPIEVIHILQGPRDIEALLFGLPLNHRPEDFRDLQIRISLWGLIQEGKKGLKPGSIDV
jgi:plasmid stabilization system protein ParE